MTTPEQQQNDPVPAPAENEIPATSGPSANDELDRLKREAAENWDKFLRATADLDNYRKRVRREKDELATFTREQIIVALLPALDDLERALEHSPVDTPLHAGLLQVQKQFTRAFAGFGLVEIIAKPGAPFDPNLHDAISHPESADFPEGTVIEQNQSGYKLGDKLLRPARVAVSKGSPKSS